MKLYTHMFVSSSSDSAVAMDIQEDGKPFILVTFTINQNVRVINVDKTLPTGWKVFEEKELLIVPGATFEVEKEKVFQSPHSRNAWFAFVNVSAESTLSS